jgi:hypothetical protein
MARATPRNCRSCKAEIYWLKNTGTGKMAPIDAGPAGPADGNIVVDLERGVYEVQPVPENRVALAGVGQLFHRNHFRTCPDQAAWRERSRTGARVPA